MDIVILIIIGALIFYWLLAACTSSPSEFELMPILDEYLKNNPQCKTNHGIKCIKCNASSIKNWGESDVDDIHRIFICNHCGTSLYRSDTLIKMPENKKPDRKDDLWLK